MLSFRTLTLLISTSALLQTASATTPADSALLQTASAATPADEKVAEKHALDVHPCADFDVAEPHDKTYDPKTIKCPFLKWTFGRARVKKVHVRNFNWQDPEQWLKILNPPTGAAADGGPILSRGEILTCTQKRLKFHGLSPKWLASVIAVAKGQGNCTRVADGGDADGCTLDLMNLFKAKAVPEILTFAQAVLRIEPSSPYYLDASKVSWDGNRFGFIGNGDRFQTPVSSQCRMSDLRGPCHSPSSPPSTVHVTMSHVRFSESCRMHRSPLPDCHSVISGHAHSFDRIIHEN